MSDITPQPTPPATPDPDAPPRWWETGFGTHPNFWWAILWCVALLLTTQVPGGVAATVILVAWMLLFPKNVPQKVEEILVHPVGQVAISVAILIAFGLMILISLALLRVVAGRDWHRQIAWRPPAWHHIPIVLAMWPAFSILAGGVYYLLRYALKLPSLSDTGLGGMEEMEKAFASWPVLLGVFLIGVLPGVGEELWCRGFLGRGLVGTHGVVLGILGTSFLFGLIHVDPCQGTMAMLMGVGLHAVYQMTRSLWMPMLLHFLNNSLAVVLARVAKDFPQVAEIDKGFGEHHFVMYAGAALVVATGFAGLYLSRARLYTPPGEPAWEPPHPGVACPPPDSPTKVVAPWSPGATMATSLMVMGLILLTAGVGLIVTADK